MNYFKFKYVCMYIKPIKYIFFLLFNYLINTNLNLILLFGEVWDKLLSFHFMEIIKLKYRLNSQKILLTSFFFNH